MQWLDRLVHWPVRSIRRRLLMALLLPMGGVMLASVPWDFQLAVAPSAAAYDESLATEAHALAEQVQWSNGRALLSLNHQAERLLRASAGDAEYFAVFDVHGHLIAGDDVLPRMNLPQDMADGETVFQDLKLTVPSDQRQPVRMVGLWHADGGEPVLVQVAETLRRRQAAERRILAAMVVPNLLIALIGALLLYAATRVTIAPIENLAREVAQRSPNDLRPVALAQAPGEIEQVLAAINRLFVRVQDAAQTQQRFHANVAHQLRTPLTGLRTQIELAQMEGCFARDELRHQRITTAIDRLSHLIDQLLSLSRAEAGVSANVRFVPVDLVALIESAASDYVDQAIDHQIDLGFQLSATPSVRGVPILLGEMLRNLVDNALRYCPAGSMVTVACGERDGRPWLAVEDDGPGISPDQRSQVFARFHRGSTTQSEGSGLGLAIVQEIAQLHGATVQALSPAQGQGVRFEVIWPPSAA